LFFQASSLRRTLVLLVVPERCEAFGTFRNIAETFIRIAVMGFYMPYIFSLKILQVLLRING
jgi:hypothetical protein